MAKSGSADPTGGETTAATARARTQDREGGTRSHRKTRAAEQRRPKQKSQAEEPSIDGQQEGGAEASAERRAAGRRVGDEQLGWDAAGEDWAGEAAGERLANIFCMRKRRQQAKRNDQDPN